MTFDLRPMPILKHATCDAHILNPPSILDNLKQSLGTHVLERGLPLVILETFSKGASSGRSTLIHSNPTFYHLNPHGLEYLQNDILFFPLQQFKTISFCLLVIVSACKMHPKLLCKEGKVECPCGNISRTIFNKVFIH